MPVMDWDGYVHLAFDEIRLAGGASPQVTRRLVAALEDLLEIAPTERRAPLAEQLSLLVAAVRASSRDERDLDRALRPDPQGIGVGNGDVAMPPAPSTGPEPAPTLGAANRRGSLRR
jgi:hypothetical protein